MLYVRIPDELVERVDGALHDDHDDPDRCALVLNRVWSEILDAQSLELQRKELEQYSRPMVPLDVPEPVWGAVAALYDSDAWTPAPNHHPEYRDARAAFYGTLAWLRKRVYWKSDLDAVLARASVEMLPVVQAE